MSLNKAIKRARKDIESLYTDKCTVIEYQEVTRPNKSTGHAEVPIITDQPCRLSFDSIKEASQSGDVYAVGQSVKLFISPDLDIAPGSKIEVERRGRVTAYQASGKPAIYDTHQEIRLELFEGWT